MNTRCLSLGLNYSYFACRKTFAQELCVSSDRLSASFPTCGKKYRPQRDQAKLWWNCGTKIWPHFACTLRSVREEIYCIYEMHIAQCNLPSEYLCVQLNHPRNSCLAWKKSQDDFVCVQMGTREEKQNETTKLENCSNDTVALTSASCASIAPMATEQTCHSWRKELWVSAVCRIRSQFNVNLRCHLNSNYAAAS